MKKQLKNMFRNKKILVTGGTGCIGSEIVRRVLKYKPNVVRIFSNDEDNAFRMMHDIDDGEDKMRHGITDRRFLIGDVRDKERLNLAMEDIDIVYHAAALKHVPLCEYNPFEAIKTNVMGTQNVVEAVLSNDVEKVINISTDKAVNPINTMGATKLLSERLVTDANWVKGGRKTAFSCVRFGNVFFSKGSVIPLFERQIREKKTVTITDPTMTRFMMPLSSAVDLVFKAMEMMRGGEIFVFKMPVVRLGDLTDVSIDYYAKKYGYEREKVKVETIGLRPGEKMFEDLMTEAESEKAFETENMIIITPSIMLPLVTFDVSDYEGAYKSTLQHYSSRDINPLSKEKIKKLLFKIKK